METEFGSRFRSTSATVERRSKRSSSSSANTKGNQAFYGFICIKWWDWPCHVRNVGLSARGPRDFPLKFHYGARPHGDTTLHACKTPPRSLSKCILKKRRGHRFSARSSLSKRFSIRFHLLLLLLPCSKGLHGLSPPPPLPPILSFEIFFDRAFRVVLIFYRDDFEGWSFSVIFLNWKWSFGWSWRIRICGISIFIKIIM